MLRLSGPRAVSASVLAAYLASAGAAFAGTDTDTFDVTADVITACDVTANDLSFGNYNPTLASPNDSSATISVICTSGAAYTLGLSAGAGTGATVAVRKMTSGANTLNYGLYQNIGRTTVWGETVGVDTVAGTGTGAAFVHTMYGRAAAQQTAPAGHYADTVTVTVAF
jgi:spore coat protein U-like protein